MAEFPLLLMNSILLYVYTTFFKKKSIDGNLGCFHALAFVSSSTMNVCVCEYLFKVLFTVLLDIYPGERLWDHRVALILTF